jgi:hypothetical protein
MSIAVSERTQLDPDYEHMAPDSPFDADDTLKPDPEPQSKHEETVPETNHYSKARDMTDNSMKKYEYLT